MDTTRTSLYVVKIFVSDQNGKYMKINDNYTLVNMLTNNKVQLLELHPLFNDIISCEELCELLKTNTSVENIRITFNNIYKKTNVDEYNRYCKLLFNVFTINRSIKFLCLNFYDIYPDTFKYMIDNIKNNNMLTSLSINTKEIDFESIAELVKENKMLKDIRLFFTQTNNILSTDSVVKSLEDNQYITFMHLSHYKIIEQRRKISKICYRNQHNIDLKCSMIQDV